MFLLQAFITVPDWFGSWYFLSHVISFSWLLISGFVSHQAVTKTVGNILVRLADSLVLPLNCSDYAESLEEYLKTAVNLYEAQLQNRNISMGNHNTDAVVGHISVTQE